MLIKIYLEGIFFIRVFHYLRIEAHAVMHNALTNMAFQINYIWIRTNVFGFGRLLIDSSRYCSCIIISQVERSV